MIEKIAKLLALAEAASTEAEAEAAFAKAQELASRHAIDLEMARRAAAPKQRETPTKKTIRVGEKGQHANRPLINLFLKISDANDVECLMARDATFIILHGLPSDLDMAEALWSSLATTMTKFADALVRDRNAAWRQETVRVWSDSEWGVVEKKVTGQGARRSFFDAFTNRIGERLMDARNASIKDADADHFHNDGDAEAIAGGSTNAPIGMALVLRQKRSEVKEFMYDDYRKTYGRKPRGSYKGGSSAARSSSAASAGRAAANNVGLSGQRGIGA